MFRRAAAAAAIAAIFSAGPGGAADGRAGKEKAVVCTACHGYDGNSTVAEVPSLAGQPELYIVLQLLLFRDKQRREPAMAPFAGGLSDKDAADIAAFFAAQAPAPDGARPPDEGRMMAGAGLAAAHHCGSCHLPDYRGRAQMPRLAGQREDYLMKAMRDYRDGRRPGFDGTMTGVLRGFGDAELETLAYFLARYR